MALSSSSESLSDMTTACGSGPAAALSAGEACPPAAAAAAAVAEAAAALVAGVPAAGAPTEETGERFVCVPPLEPALTGEPREPDAARCCSSSSAHLGFACGILKPGSGTLL